MSKIIHKKKISAQSGNVLTEYTLALAAITLGLLIMMPSFEASLDSTNSELKNTYSQSTDYPPALILDAGQASTTP